MKKETWKTVIQVIISILTAAVKKQGYCLVRQEYRWIS